MKIMTVCLLLAHVSLVLPAEEPSVLHIRRKTEDESPALALLTPQHIELGVIPCHGTITREYRLRNNGTNDVKIGRIVSTCNCIQGEASTNTVAPNAELTVTSKLDAAKVHGTFKRGIWLNFAEPESKPVSLSVSGTVRDLFAGFPKEPRELFNLSPGRAVTNVFTFTATEIGVALGVPDVLCPDGVSFDYAITTNDGDLASYTLTTSFAIKDDNANPVASLSFPVLGASQPLPPMVLRLKAGRAKRLDITPGYIGLEPDKPDVQMFRLVLKSRREALAHEKLAWEALPEGVHIHASTCGRRRSLINAIVTVSPDAAAQLLKSESPQKITFRYPQHESAEIVFGPSGSAAHQASQRVTRRPRRRLFLGVVEDEETEANPDPASPPEE